MRAVDHALLVLGVVRIFQPADHPRAQANPFSHVVDGARAAFRGDLGDSSLFIGLGAAAVLAVFGLAVANRTFQREAA